jgi:hypothetical protein
MNEEALLSTVHSSQYSYFFSEDRIHVGKLYFMSSPCKRVPVFSSLPEYAFSLHLSRGLPFLCSVVHSRCALKMFRLYIL